MYDILNGLRVVEGSAFVAAPLGGLTLAQLGADVIRFDMIGGGIDFGRWPLDAKGNSLYWASLNKGKRSIAINLKSPEGRELVAELVAAPGEGGGIFLTNLPQREPLSYESLRERRADVIMLQISGHNDGATALDYTVNSAVGVPLATGRARPDAPVNNMLPAWDLATGLNAATGILAAERHRRQTGGGRFIGLALSDVAYATMGHLGHIAEAQINRTERQPHGNEIFGAFGRDFETCDRRRVMVAAISLRQWQSLCEATQNTENVAHIAAMLGADFSDEGQRYEARDLLFPLFERYVRRFDYATIRERFDAHNVCWGPYQSFLQMVDEDPRCSVANPIFERVEQPGVGNYLMPGSALRFKGLDSVPVRPAPLLGQHTDQILGDILGLSSTRIGELHDAGIVAGSKAT